ATERLNDPALAAWCVRRALRIEPRAEDLLLAEPLLASPAREAEHELDATLAELAGTEGDARVSLLRRAAGALRGFPSRAEKYTQVLVELCERRPDELRFRRLLEALLARQGDGAGLARLWTHDLLSVK